MSAAGMLDFWNDFAQKNGLRMLSLEDQMSHKLSFYAGAALAARDLVNARRIYDGALSIDQENEFLAKMDSIVQDLRFQISAREV